VPYFKPQKFGQFLKSQAPFFKPILSKLIRLFDWLKTPTCWVILAEIGQLFNLKHLVTFFVVNKLSPAPSSPPAAFYQLL